MNSRAAEAADQQAEVAGLDALARKERMNTPGRRAVFCVLMGAEDYTDAVEKLSRIGSKGRAERCEALFSYQRL